MKETKFIKDMVLKLNLYGLEIEYIDDENLYKQIINLWKKLNYLKSKNNIKLPYPWRKYRVIYQKDNKYFYFCGFEVAHKDNINGLINREIDINTCIQYEYKGIMGN